MATRDGLMTTYRSGMCTRRGTIINKLQRKSIALGITNEIMVFGFWAAD
jgi:hypothetical protein